LGGLVALVLIAALVAPYFINWSEYRAEFEREAARILGQKVTVAGDATARLLPFPSVTFEDVRVGEPDRPLVVADRFSMDAELAPFLSGEILIFDMRLENPEITLELDERGLPVWPLPEDSPVSPAQVTLESAKINNATVVLHDRIAGRSWEMEGLDATVSAESLFGPFRITGDGRLNGTQLGFRINTGALSKDGFSLRTIVDLPGQGIELGVDGRVAEPETAGAAPYNGTFSMRPLEATPESRYVVEGGFAASPRSFEVAEYRAEFGAAEDPYVVTGSAGISGGTDPGYHIEIRGTQVTLAEDGRDRMPVPAAPHPFPSGLQACSRRWSGCRCRRCRAASTSTCRPSWPATRRSAKSGWPPRPTTATARMRGGAGRCRTSPRNCPAARPSRRTAYCSCRWPAKRAASRASPATFWSRRASLPASRHGLPAAPTNRSGGWPMPALRHGWS
jgi:hypothetical protein